MLGAMSGRRFLGIGCVSLTLLAIYACGNDNSDVDVSDVREDGGSIDGALNLPEGSARDNYVPPTVLPPSSLALGEGFGCIIGADHAVYCWGKNDVGQLGSDPAKTPSCGAYPCTPLPVKVDGFNGAQLIAIAAGKDFACALDDAKHGWCWGSNAKKQIAARKGETFRFTPEIVTDGTAQIVAAGQHACILDTDGFMHCWGDNDCNLFGTVDAGSLNVVELVSPQMKWVSLGPDSMCTVSVSGEAFCWGADHNGSLGHPVPSNAGTCAGGVPFDPSPKRWVSDKLGHILSGVEEIHSGGAVACARLTDGSVLCAGDNTHGGLGLGVADSDRHEVPTAVPGVKTSMFAVSGETVCAVVADKLLCWGDARYGQLEFGGPGTTCDGTGCRPLGYVLPNQEGIRNLAMSPGGIGTIKNDVSAWVWGRNDSSETGVSKDDALSVTCSGGTKCIPSPRQMPNPPPLN